MYYLLSHQCSLGPAPPCEELFHTKTLTYMPVGKVYCLTMTLMLHNFTGILELFFYP